MNKRIKKKLARKHYLSVVIIVEFDGSDYMAKKYHLRKTDRDGEFKFINQAGVCEIIKQGDRLITIQAPYRAFTCQKLDLVQAKAASDNQAKLKSESNHLIDELGNFS